MAYRVPAQRLMPASDARALGLCRGESRAAYRERMADHDHQQGVLHQLRPQRASGVAAAGVSQGRLA